MILAAALSLAAADPACAGGLVEVGDYGIHTTVEGKGPVTVVFESGNGNDGTVWEDMASRLAAHGYKTLRYDRAGLGQSDPRPGDDYDVTREVGALRNLLDVCAIDGPVLMVAHSYGGMIASMMAAEDDRVKALLMLDATNRYTEFPERTERLWAMLRPRYEGVRAQSPAMADHIIPLMEAWNETDARVEQTTIEDPMPAYLLVRGVASSDEDNLEEWQSGMREFAAQSPYRFMTIAPGIGHKVAQERPDWVEASALQLLEWIETYAD